MTNIVLSLNTLLLLYLCLFKNNKPIYISSSKLDPLSPSSLSWFQQETGDIVRKEQKLPDNIDDLLQ